MKYKPTILNISTAIFLISILIYTIRNYKTLSSAEGWGIVAMVGLLGVMLIAGIIDLILQQFIKSRIFLNIVELIFTVIINLLNRMVNNLKQKTYFYILIISVILAFQLNGQKIDPLPSNCIPLIDTLQGKNVLYIAEVMPKFPGGDIEFHHFIAKNIKYPEIDKDIIQTKITATFVIDSTGKVVNECIINPLHNNTLTPLEKCILDVIEKLPNWKPAEQNGEKVPIRITVPININPMQN